MITNEESYISEAHVKKLGFALLVMFYGFFQGKSPSSYHLGEHALVIPSIEQANPSSPIVHKWLGFGVIFRDP